jgi:hypothetical protein
MRVSLKYTAVKTPRANGADHAATACGRLKINWDEALRHAGLAFLNETSRGSKPVARFRI